MGNPPILPPPDDSQQAPPVPVTGATQGQPQAPPRETFRQGFARGGGGEQYVVDAQGNLVSARTTTPSRRGQLGSILAGMAIGALQGATAARPGGIPSEQLGGGAGAGAKAATDYLQGRDLLRRQQAEQDFARRQSAEKMTREQAESAAQINLLNAQTAREAQNAQFEAEEHPYVVRQKQLENEAAAATAQQIHQTLDENNLKLYQTLADLGIQPDVVINQWAQATPYAKDFAQGRTLGLVNGQRGQAMGVGLFDADALKRPLTKDVTYASYTADPKTGDPVAQTHTLKAGSADVMTYVSAAMAGQAQLNRLLSNQKVQAEIEQQKAETKELQTKAGLEETQLNLLKQTGIRVPDDYVPAANSFSLDQGALQTSLSQKGVTVPGNFATLYAIAHYKQDPKTLPARTFNRPGQAPQMDEQTGMAYIRNFINPGYDDNNYKAVQELEKQFASTQANTAGGNLLSFNAAVGHLGQLYDAAQALRTGDVQTLNRIANAVGQEFGRPVQPNFQAIKTVLVGELGRVLEGKAPDVPEMGEIRTALQASNSPEQFQGVARQYAHAMLTKGVANIDKYYAYTGELPPSTFSPATLDVFRRMGIDATAALPQGAAVPVGQTADAQGRTAAPATPNAPDNVVRALGGVGAGWHSLSNGTYWYKGADGSLTEGDKADYDRNQPPGR